MMKTLSAATLLAATFASLATAAPRTTSIEALTITNEGTRLHCNDGFTWDAKEEMCMAAQSR